MSTEQDPRETVLTAMETLAEQYATNTHEVMDAALDGFASGGHVNGDGEPVWFNFGQELGCYPVAPEKAERTLRIWKELAALGDRLVPEIKAATEKILADADRLADGQRLGNALVGRVIVDEVQTWPLYRMRVSGRIT